MVKCYKYFSDGAGGGDQTLLKIQIQVLISLISPGIVICTMPYLYCFVWDFFPRKHTVVKCYKYISDGAGGGGGGGR